MANHRHTILDIHKIRIIIVEDEPDLLAGFIQILSASPQIEVVGSASTLKAALLLVKNTNYDVLLCDIGLPDGSGIDAIKLASEIRPESESMVISLFGDEERVVESMRAGAKSYILKDEQPADFIQAILDLRNGKSPISPKIARLLLKRFQLIGDINAEKSPLTAQETKVLTLIAHGKSTKVVAKELGISDLTASEHCKNIYRKLNVHSRTEAVVKSKQVGWI